MSRRRGRMGDPNVPPDDGGAGAGAGHPDAGVQTAVPESAAENLQGRHDVRASPDQGPARTGGMLNQRASRAALRGPNAGGQELQGGSRASALLVLLRHAVVLLEARVRGARLH